jgi:hypothetical protein
MLTPDSDLARRDPGGDPGPDDHHGLDSHRHNTAQVAQRTCDRCASKLEHVAYIGVMRLEQCPRCRAIVRSRPARSAVVAIDDADRTFDDLAEAFGGRDRARTFVADLARVARIESGGR